jgi:hypothetical protein
MDQGDGRSDHALQPALTSVVKRLALFIVLVACGGEPEPKFSVERLQDPNTCMECHPKHFEQWSGSMHAYASVDPVFVAMNKRGQRETNGQLGTFCVQCHAPMAVALGTITNDNAKDFDLSTLADSEKGVTCYFCHNVDKIVADHNNPLVLAMDQTMRGGARDPTNSPAHDSAYDKRMDGPTSNSEECGGCHDLVTPRGVALERTFAEWRTSLFAHEDPITHLPPTTCSGCHMLSSDDPIADKPGLHVRPREDGFHEHMWPGIDRALQDDWPQKDEQLAAIHRDLDVAIQVVGFKPLSGFAKGGICFGPDGKLSVRVDSIQVGHKFPSGASQDRRAWLEVKAYNASGDVIFSRGANVPDGKDPESLGDPSLLGLWDRTYTDGTKRRQPAHFFWDVGAETSQLIRVPVDPASDHSVLAKYDLQFAPVDHITTRVLMQPLPFETLDLLVQSGDLDPAVVARPELRPIEVEGATRTWTKPTADPASGCNPK